MTQENELQMVPGSPRVLSLPPPGFYTSISHVPPTQLTHCAPQEGVPEKPAEWGRHSHCPEQRKGGKVAEPPVTCLLTHDCIRPPPLPTPGVRPCSELPGGFDLSPLPQEGGRGR